MKYFSTQYSVEKPIEIVFEKALDLVALHENIGIFEKAYVTTDEFPFDKIGKSYSVVNQHGSIAVRCIITLVELENPRDNKGHYKYLYTYETKNEKGVVEVGCPFLPWESMSCHVSFNGYKSNTSITMFMEAHNVRSFWGKLIAKVMGAGNKFQQLKYNKRTSAYIQGEG